MKFNIEDVLKFAQARKTVADQIIAGLVNPAAPQEDVPLPAEGVTAEQWRNAGGIVPLAQDPGVPMRDMPAVTQTRPNTEPRQTLRGADFGLDSDIQLQNAADLAPRTPVSAPPTAAEAAQPQVYERPRHIQLAMEFLASKKGESFEPAPYPDGVDKKTKAQKFSIGFGQQQDPRTGADVNMVTAPITKDEAIIGKEAYLLEADRKLDTMLMVPVTPSKRAALLSLMYNIGWKAFRDSSVLEAVNTEAPPEELWKALRQYNVGTWKDKKGKMHTGPMKGLDKRRKAEFVLSKMPDPPEE
jgi:GH24 family phage-related lysozyme (muramidase)